MIFIMQQINAIKDKITNSHQFFQPNLISIKRWFRMFFSGFIYLISMLSWYLWMHFMLFISVFRRNTVKCFCKLNFRYIRYFAIIYDIFQAWFNFVKVFFQGIREGFCLGILIAAIKYTCCYRFLMIFLFLLRKVLYISHDSVLYWFNYFVFHLFFQFLSTSIHIVDMFWFDIILSCGCLKEIHNFLFKAAYRFF